MRMKCVCEVIAYEKGLLPVLEITIVVYVLFVIMYSDAGNFYKSFYPNRLDFGSLVLNTGH